MSPSDGLVARGLRSEYDGAPVLRGVDLDVPAGTVVALVGPNGSGKTTLLRALAGLEPLVAGAIQLDGRRLDGVPTHRRGVGMLFQEPALFPGRTVAENVAYGLELAGVAREARTARVGALLERLELAELAARPAEALSGGERQRTALARTLAPRPRLVLLDEPFAAVDPELRGALRAEFRQVLEGEGVAALHVTHDPEEALAVGARMVVLRDGRAVQAGDAEGVFRAPAEPATARFLGYNVLRDGERTVAVHPRELREGTGPGPSWEARVVSVRPALGESLVRLRRVADDAAIEWRRRPVDGAAPVVGTTLRVHAERPVEFGTPADRP